jgi:cytochrome c-type biogenesis protein CcmH/NrfG
MKKSTSEIWREGQAKAGVKNPKTKQQWQIDVQEFDEEIEQINKKILILGVVCLLNFCVTSYIFIKLFH